MGIKVSPVRHQDLCHLYEPFHGDALVTPLKVRIGVKFSSSSRMWGIEAGLGRGHLVSLRPPAQCPSLPLQ